MAGLVSIDGYDDLVINICPNGTEGDIVEIADIFIQLPSVPKDPSKILFSEYAKEEQYWRRLEIPQAISSIKSMDEWQQQPDAFKERYTPYIVEEFRRRREGVWFMNNGAPTYITGHHYMLLQWSPMDIGYPNFLDFQRRLTIHLEACVNDSRSFGQAYTKTRRTGYSNIAGAVLVDDGTQTKNKLLGIISKTGKDAQEGVFMNKVVPMYRAYPFFFKPIQDGTTNPRAELAFREPSQRITKDNKTSNTSEALDTVINWRNLVENAYDSSKLLWLFLDEAGKYEDPIDVNTLWRIHKTCLLMGKKIVGKAMVGSTVNPLPKGGAKYKKLYFDSDPKKRDGNGRTKSGLYKIFIPAFEALEGFFDIYGMPIVDDPESPVLTIDGDYTSIGAKTYLQNDRKGRMHDPNDLNENIRQFPWTESEAFRDSTVSSTFNIAAIYQQLEHNGSMFPAPVVRGNFAWSGTPYESPVVWIPNENGKFYTSWIPPEEYRNKHVVKNGKKAPANGHIGGGGVDSYDIDETVDARSSKGSLHLINRLNMIGPKGFVLEYAERPPLAAVFYEDVLMAAVFYGYPLLIENNKYGIVRHFERYGYDEYIMDRPEHLKVAGSAANSKTKGVPSNSKDLILTHSIGIEAHIYDNVGIHPETGEMGHMYFDRTLEDWIGFRITDRTKYDLTISSGLAILSIQAPHKTVKHANMSDAVFFRKTTVRR